MFLSTVYPAGKKLTGVLTNIIHFSDDLLKFKTANIELTVVQRPKT
jgi:hypothetical protein